MKDVASRCRLHLKMTVKQCPNDDDDDDDGGGGDVRWCSSTPASC